MLFRLRRNGVAIIVNKRVQNRVLGCNLKNDRMICVCFQGKPFNITVIQVYAPTSNAEEADVERFYEDLLLLLSRFSHVRVFVTLWTVTCQVPLSMGFSRQEYWNGLPCPPPGNLPDPGIKLPSLMSPALAGGFFTTSAT